MNKIKTFKSEQNFTQTVADNIVEQIKAKQGVFRIALSGGSTPVPIYKKLSESDLTDWSKVEIYLVDERYVPADCEYSNQKLITEKLTKKLPTPPLRWVSFDCSLPIKKALEKYEKNLNSSDPQFFDLVLLGLGSDGHTASLFPNDKLIQEQTRWVGHSKNGKPIPDRLTLTYPALESSKKIMILVQGESKKYILNQLLTAQSSLPASRIFNNQKTSLYFGDY